MTSLIRQRDCPCLKDDSDCIKERLCIYGRSYGQCTAYRWDIGARSAAVLRSIGQH